MLSSPFLPCPSLYLSLSPPIENSFLCLLLNRVIHSKPAKLGTSSLVCPFLLLYLSFLFSLLLILYLCDQCQNVVEFLIHLYLQLPATATWLKATREININMGVGGVCSRRLLLGALVSLGVIWFMFLAISVNRQTKKTVIVPLHVISKHLKLVSMQRHALHSKSGLIFVSKRRVPNGPDPIHNRRAVKYRQPPTQA